MTTMIDLDDPLMEELLDAAFEVLSLHPGCSYDQWRHILMEQYATEVTDAFVPNLSEADIADGLKQVWQAPYEYKGTIHTVADWATILNK